jgi:flagellar basal body-associated protein FliL
MSIDITIDSTLIVNILVHILILFVFLYLFFFFFISRIEENTINSQVDNLADNKITSILAEIDKMDTKKYINWDIVKKTAEEELIDDENINEFIHTNNTNLKYIGIIVAISILLLAITVYYYYTYYKNEKVDLWHIIKENVAVFLVIGIIEFVFFKTTAIKYVPITTSEIGKSMFERIKENIMNL